MWLLFDIGNSRILGAATTPDQLRFEEDELPTHLQAVRISRVESIEDPLFLSSQKWWPELNLRRLYVFLKLSPPLTPTKFNDAAFMDLRLRIRAGIAAGLGLEPSTLPPLEVYNPVINVVVSTPPLPPRMPNARRGSVGPQIHSIATEMWEAAGKPKDIPTLLQLRQTIMKVLNDEHKIRTSTSSNELGRWQKQLLTS